MAPSKGKHKVEKAKYDKLKKRIESGKAWTPKVGDYIYTDTRISISHGWDDVIGGLSTVKEVHKSMSGGDPECVFVRSAEHERSFNWSQILLPDQKDLMKKFKKNFAYPDPDEVSEDW